MQWVALTPQCFLVLSYIITHSCTIVFVEFCGNCGASCWKSCPKLTLGLNMCVNIFRHDVLVFLSSVTCSKVSLILDDSVGICYTIGFKEILLYLQNNMWYNKIRLSRIV